jgi:hypothetical protein
MTPEQWNRDVRLPAAEESALFADRCQKPLATIGLPLTMYCSQPFQHKNGESLLGLEMKYDRMSLTTGNLFLEVAERSYPPGGPFVLSGVMNDNNPLFYGIGNERVLYVFSVRTLRKVITIYQDVHFPITEANLCKANGLYQTRGFLMKMESRDRKWDAERMAEVKLEFAPLPENAPKSTSFEIDRVTRLAPEPFLLSPVEWNAQKEFDMNFE